MSLFIILFWLSFSSQLLAAEKDMIRIKAGCFMMGTNQDAIYEDDDNNYREKPAHKVCLDGFYIDTYEVTQKKMERCYENEQICFPPSRTTYNSYLLA